jgi:hypothetical protein
MIRFARKWITLTINNFKNLNTLQCELVHQYFEKTRMLYTYILSQDSVVGTATSYWLDDRGVGVRVPVW